MALAKYCTKEWIILGEKAVPGDQSITKSIIRLHAAFFERSGSIGARINRTDFDLTSLVFLAMGSFGETPPCHANYYIQAA